MQSPEIISAVLRPPFAVLILCSPESYSLAVISGLAMDVLMQPPMMLTSSAPCSEPGRRLAVSHASIDRMQPSSVIYAETAGSECVRSCTRRKGFTRLEISVGRLGADCDSVSPSTKLCSFPMQSSNLGLLRSDYQRCRASIESPAAEGLRESGTVAGGGAACGEEFTGTDAERSGIANPTGLEHGGASNGAYLNDIDARAASSETANGGLHAEEDNRSFIGASTEGEIEQGEEVLVEEGKQGMGEERRESPKYRTKERKSKAAAIDEEIDQQGGPEGLTPADIAREVARRRNFAIISHPDAGKTTLTEKLLLFGGAIHEAGAVKARRAARHATSDWMELEKQRGISITSTAMVFETKGKQITLLDTPGHQDFGEDTYRTLAAADNAVMLVDAGKGLEPQTRKLFQVCRMRHLPIFTFINKMDRPALEALELLDQIEKEFDLATYPVNWPIGSGDRFKGVYHRPRGEVHLYSRDATHGLRGTSAQVIPWGDPVLEELIEADLYEKLLEEVEMLEQLTPPLDLEQVHSGDLTPVYFGSAFNNFGVELFLDSFLEYAISPGSHETDLGEVPPDHPQFTGFVFKLQANMDPKHRDKVAFVRVCSGVFHKGMKVQLARTGKTLALTRPQKLFAQDRSVIETGFAGDVIGLNNPNAFAIGDSLYVGPRRTFPGIPSFSPELFCYLRNPNPSKYKQFQKGLTELLGEGAVQVLHSLDDGRPDPILAAVGQLQFEVVQYRMLAEYGVETGLEPLGFSVARWVQGGWAAVEKAGRLFNCQTVKDQWGRPVLLFRNEWNVGQLLGDHPEIGELAPYALPPVEVAKK